MQIKCGDLYEDGAVQTFNACAVSDKKCVPQRVDTDKYPVSTFALFVCVHVHVARRLWTLASS